MQNLFEEVSSLDRRCYDAYGLSEDLLMEHAAEAMAVAVRKRFAPRSRVLIVAGPGNNGADGIALARLLHGRYDVRLMSAAGEKSAMAKIQRARANKAGVACVDALEPCDVLVDALFGSGLARPLDAKMRMLVAQMNAAEAFKIACDVPTGIYGDGRCDEAVFRADLTVTMGALKRAMFSDAAKNAVGEIVVADLGVDRSLYETDADWKVLDRDDLRLPYRERENVHKGTFGHLGIVCGEKSGAAIIAGRAALRFGAGLVTLLSNESVQMPYELMQSHLPPRTLSALAVGMGLGQEFSADELQTLLAGELPIVADADLFAHPLLETILRRKQVVLTPHPKEFATLLARVGIADVDAQGVQDDRFALAEAFCRAYPDAVLLLKGANVIIGQNDRFFVNPHGTNVLAKGGSGDVLAGLIGALLAQGYTPLDAAIHASLAHTEAARRFDGANYALTPDDLIGGIASL